MSKTIRTGPKSLWTYGVTGYKRDMVLLATIGYSLFSKISLAVEKDSNFVEKMALKNAY